MGTLQRRLDDLKHAGRRSQRAHRTSPAPSARELPDVMGGRRAICQGKGYWELIVPFSRICESSLPDGAFGTSLQCEGRPNERLLVDPASTLVLDIETGGFSGTPVFLIGVVALDRRPLCVEQWLARDYPEEEAILHRLAQRAGTRSTWVTFNGKAFDAPFVLDRARLYRIAMQPPRTHVDLLHAARRCWRGALPDYRLETLEQHVLGRTRAGDVPGSDVPDLFHHFIRTGNAAPLRSVLEHNQLDLVSSTELLLRIALPDASG